MREILFKAKRVNNGEWVAGYYCKWLKGERIITYSEKETDCIITWMSNGGMSRYEVVPETLCQFTGLCDKNGKRIWENDIIQYDAVAAVVKFGEYGNGNLGFYVDFPEETNYRKDFSYWAKKVVVIGNAVDDRSLLQEVLE